MAKRKGAKTKKHSKRKAKIRVKSKFVKALQSLRKMKTQEQRMRTKNASNEFIQDVSRTISRLRTRPDLVNSKHRRILKRYKKPLRQLVNRASSIKQKRKVLLLRGGIFPALIPILCATIGAAGAVGASAAGAAVMKS